LGLLLVFGPLSFVISVAVTLDASTVWQEMRHPNLDPAGWEVWQGFVKVRDATTEDMKRKYRQELSMEITYDALSLLAAFSGVGMLFSACRRKPNRLLLWWVRRRAKSKPSPL
jgi:hypothetical protein